MPAPSGSRLVADGPAAQIAALDIQLPLVPVPLGAYVVVAEAGSLLFLSGTLPLENGKLAIVGRLGDTLSIDEGREAARLASLNALAAAKEHLGDLNRLKKLVKLTVSLATTEQFTEHAAVADQASELFAQIFSKRAGHARMVYGVLSLPKGAPVVVETVFEISP